MSDSKKLALLILVMSALRAAAACAFPLNASEAYYWCWGRHLAAGYYDHPPMVAWVAALFAGWVNGSELAARCGPIVLGALTTLVIFALAKELFPGGRTAWRAALLYALTPLFDLNAVILQPDNPLILFTTLTWLLFWRAARDPSRLTLWAAAGLTAGLALLSKFHAWVLLPPLWGFLVLSPEHRRAWKTPGPYGAAAIALAVLSPNLLWNARHDWLNYVFQWNRSGLPRAGFHPAYAVELIAGTALALSPLVFVAMVCGVWRGFRLWRTAREPRVLFLLCAGLPLVAFLFALSFGVQISLHWPAGGYGALLILAVGLMERGELFGPRFRRAMLGMAAAMTLALHLAPYLVMSLPDDSGVSWIPETLKMSRVKSKFVGWREIGEKARSLRDEMNVQTPTVIMAKTRHMAAVLAFYSQCPTSVFAAEADSAHNFGLWFREAGGLRGVNAVFIIRKDEPNQRHSSLTKKYDKYMRFLGPLFQRARAAPSLVVDADGSVREFWGAAPDRPLLCEFLIFRCVGFKGALAP